jgi:hypothetical protein
MEDPMSDSDPDPGRVLRRTADDEIPAITERVARERDRRQLQVHLRYAVALGVFIVVPPLILALGGAALPVIVAAAIGIGLNLVGAYVGYRAVSLKVEIDRG